jgi:hypothetical protein
VTPAIGSPNRFRAARRALGAVIAAVLALTVGVPRPARADLDVYGIAGTIEKTDYGVLFPAKSVGQTFHGSFTIDTDALLESVGAGNDYATYTGEFAVVIEGVSFPVSVLQVWSSGPTGIDDGFQLTFSLGPAIGFLSLRSTHEIYLLPVVPTAVDLAGMNSLADVELGEFYPQFDLDSAVIEQLPEANGAMSALAASAALVASRVRELARRLPRSRATS